MEKSNFDSQLYTIPVNDQGFNLYLRVGDNNVWFGYDEAITFLMPVTRVVQSGNTVDVYLFNKKCFSVEDNRIIPSTSHISSTELRNIGMLLRENDDNHSKNEAYFSRSGIMINGNVKTELHTHLIEILPSSKFLDFIEKFNGKVKIDSEGNINFTEGTDFSVSDIKNLPNLYNNIIKQLEIPVDRVGDFNELEKKVENRTRLLLGVSDLFAKNSGYDDFNEARVLVTKILLHDSLVYLRDNNVKYVEISHSNVKVINRILETLDTEFFEHIAGINFRFLFSSSRLKSAKDFRQCGRYLEDALDMQSVVGFDLMGLESKFSDEDLNPNAKDSLYRKLSPIVLTLSKYNNTVLRLHSGEFADTEENTEQLLEIISLIEKDNQIKLPPPEIRIGHGLHITKNPKLVELLKKYNCVVEINASSNFALSNVADLSEIPYQFYIDNGIRVVLSTDGGGFYRTSPEQERFIAKTFVGAEGLDRLNETDEEIYRMKVGGVVDVKKGR